MENNNEKLKYLYRFNIGLLTVNIAALVIWLMLTIFSQPDLKTNFSSNDFLREELDLTDEQYNKINDLDKDNFEAYDRVVHYLCKRKRELLYEIIKDTVDDRRIDQLTLHIGHLHVALKRQTVNHLLNVKAVCNDKQKDKLREMFDEVLEVNTDCE